MSSTKPSQRISDREKVIAYEAYLHDLQLYSVVMASDKIRQLVSNACAWSYAHRVGNGQHSDEEQQAIVDRALNNLCTLKEEKKP